MHATDFGAPAGSFMEGFLNPEAAIYIFIALVLVASAGSIAGFLTRKIIVLICILGAGAALLFFHQHLPLPVELHADLETLKTRLGL